MIAGLPGTGIGGAFYLLCAFLMPVCEIYHTFRGNSSFSRWKMVFRQFFMASAIMAGFWLIGAVFLFFRPVFQHHIPGSGVIINKEFLRFQPIVFSLTTLLFVILAVFVTRIILKLKK